MLELLGGSFLLLAIYATARMNSLRTDAGSMDKINKVLEDGRIRRAIEDEELKLKHQEYLRSKYAVIYPGIKIIFDDEKPLVNLSTDF